MIDTLRRKIVKSCVPLPHRLCSGVRIPPQNALEPSCDDFKLDIPSIGELVLEDAGLPPASQRHKAGDDPSQAPRPCNIEKTFVDFGCQFAEQRTVFCFASPRNQKS